MGYTHYWRTSAKAIPDAAVVMLRELLAEAHAAGIVQLEDTTPKPPLVTATVIRFNGVGALGHETFFFDVEDAYRAADGTPFAFCKTNQKPYDAVVMKVLIVLRHFLGEQITVTSDGSFDDEWGDVRAEMEERYGITTIVEAKLETAS